MTEAVAGSVWWLRVSAIAWFILAMGCVLALPILFDATGLLVVAAIVIALVVGAVLAWFIRLFSGRSKHFAVTWLKSSLASFFILTILAAAPIYYFAFKTELEPALLPRVTMSDGNRTVIIQGMMHIGTERFYKSVVYDAERALSEGYVLYYEGVQPNPEADKWFSDTLAGGGDLSANYKALAEICGLQFQLDYFDLLDKDAKLHPERHIKADVDTLDMKREYDHLIETDPAFAEAVEGGKVQKAKAESASGMASAINWLQEGTQGQRKLAGYFCRWSLNGVGTKPKEGEEPDQMKKVILHYRNRALADRIAADSNDKIYITYGAAHIRGVVDLLKEKDSSWKIESVTWARPIDTPEKLEGEL